MQFSLFGTSSSSPKRKTSLRTGVVTAFALTTLTIAPSLASAQAAAPTATDPLFSSSQWALNPALSSNGINLGDVWSQTKGEGAVVGILDSGVDFGHEDLSQTVSMSRNFLPGKSGKPAQDDFSHGTHVAGIIAAAQNGKGVSGIAPGSKLYVAKVLDKKGVGANAGIAKALEAMGKEGVPIVNMSIGGEFPTPEFKKAMAKYPGTLYVVTAGNTGKNIDSSKNKRTRSRT